MSFCKGHGCSTAAPILALREAMTIAKGSTLIMHWGREVLRVPSTAVKGTCANNY